MGSVNNTGAYVLGVREKRADARTRNAGGGKQNYDTRHVAIRTSVPPGVMDNLRTLAVHHDITISSLLRNYIADGLVRDRHVLENAKHNARRKKKCESP